jgi:hypothetical protein
VSDVVAIEEAAAALTVLPVARPGEVVTSAA